MMFFTVLVKKTFWSPIEHNKPTKVFEIPSYLKIDLPNDYYYYYSMV